MFYTGIPKLSTFSNLCKFISPFDRRKWFGVKSTKNLTVNLSNQICTKKGPACKLTKYDEFLITLMKMHLGSLNDCKADRFKTSRTLISKIFSTCVRVTAKVLSSMVKVLDLDTVNTLKPKRFKSQKLHSIADATEILIQTLKDHLLQHLTCSN